MAGNCVCVLCDCCNFFVDDFMAIPGYADGVRAMKRDWMLSDEYGPGVELRLWHRVVIVILVALLMYVCHWDFSYTCMALEETGGYQYIRPWIEKHFLGN